MRRPLTPEQHEQRKAKRRAWYKEKQGEITAYHREYRAQHREKVNARLKEWREKNIERVRETGRRNDRKRSFKRGLFLRHKISVEDYLRLLEDQGGCCAICLTEGPRHGDGIIRLDVDHDHKTGLIRGLLCNPCNTGIGHMHDDVEMLKRAIAYLQQAAKAVAAADESSFVKHPRNKKKDGERHSGKLWMDLAKSARTSKRRNRTATRFEIAKQRLLASELKKEKA